MYLEALRKRLAKLAAKAPSVPKTPKTPGLSGGTAASTPKMRMNVAKPPKIKMPNTSAPSAPKLPDLKFPSLQSTLSSASVPPIFQNVFSQFNPMNQSAFNPQDFVKNLFNSNAGL